MCVCVWGGGGGGGVHNTYVPYSLDSYACWAIGTDSIGGVSFNSKRCTFRQYGLSTVTIQIQKSFLPLCQLGTLEIRIHKARIHTPTPLISDICTKNKFGLSYTL